MMNLLLRTAVSAAVVAGLASTALAQSAVPKIDKLSRPGIVAVDVAARQTFFKEKGWMGKKDSGGPGQACDTGANLVWGIAPIKGIIAPADYGIDKRLPPVGENVMRMGAACLGGAPVIQCETILRTVHEWAKADALVPPAKPKNETELRNAVLSANLNILKPFLVNYAIARAVISVPPETDKEIQQWALKALRRNAPFMRLAEIEDRGAARGLSRQAQNHQIVAAGAHMAYGALWDDPKMFQTGIDQWFITLKTMRADGSFPLESRRGSRAIFYSGRTLIALLSIAEMASLQGIDLYPLAPVSGRDIRLAAHFVADAYENIDKISPYAKENFAPGPHSDWKVQDLQYMQTIMSWIYPYRKRFPDDPLSTRFPDLKQDQRILIEGGPRSTSQMVQRTELLADWFGGDISCFYKTKLFGY